jgi:tRNA threonylcarbamoyl adenosine modification protein YeaZ
VARHILAFDTSAAHCAAALLCDGQITASRIEPMEKGQAERLIPLLETLLTEAHLTWRDLSALAVGTGPGNFTGVRIAVAAARGLALSLGIPAIGVTRLQALAHGLPHPLMVVEDARRGEVYVQEFGTDCPDARLTDIASLPLETDVQAFTGSAADAAAAATGGHVLPQPLPLAEAIAWVAHARPHTPAATRPAPFYLRGAEAAPPSDPPPVILP